jgi:malate dehydrogenase (oxaloacetate-decarboxylating)(NADP+)
MHDDQHGTAIVSGAALLGALEIVGKQIDRVRVVFVGAGAAGLACAGHYLRLGVQRERMLMVDTKGVIYTGRTEDMNPYKARFARDTELRTLTEALREADVLVGLSAKGAVLPDMLKIMAPRPIVFALANPDPEITPEDAHHARDDLIMATGRSDYPNQVNNVLGFPFVFRGALDVRASAINEQMKLAATHALAALARETVPESVCQAYGVEEIQFGPEYIVPKPFDPRALVWVASAVAQAAMQSGVARQSIDLEEYREQLECLGTRLLLSRPTAHDEPMTPSPIRTGSHSV